MSRDLSGKMDHFGTKKGPPIRHGRYIELRTLKGQLLGFLPTIVRIIDLQLFFMEPIVRIIDLQLFVMEAIVRIIELKLCFLEIIV